MRSIIVIFILNLAVIAGAQDCLLQNPLVVSKANLNESYVKNLIAQKAKIFELADINSLKSCIDKNNLKVENEITALRSRATNYSLDKQELLKLRDIAKIKEQVAEKQKSLEKIKEQVKADLATIVYKGLYISVINNLDPFKFSPSELQERARTQILPIAIEQINGTFIQSVTDLYRNNGRGDQLSQFVQGLVSGEMGIDKMWGKRTKSQTQYIYFAKVNVSPLKKGINTQAAQYADDKNNSLVSNLFKEQDYKTRLQQAGVSAADIAELEAQANMYKETVLSENQTADRMRDQFLSGAGENIRNLETEITNLNQQYNNSIDRLKKSITEKTNVQFNASNPKQSIDAALKYIDDKITETYRQMLQAKEGEYLVLPDRPVSNEGNPADDIARTTMQLAGQMDKSYGKIDQFVKLQELLNSEFTKDERGQQSALFRGIEKLWLYPVPGDNSDYRLTLVAKFKITENTNTSTSSTGFTEIILPETGFKNFTETTANLNLEMVAVTGGKFKMGSNGNDDEKPIHEVTVGNFYIGKYEVTQAQWKAVMNSSPSYFKNCDNCPVETVSWDDVQEFIQKLNQKTGKKYRLPTEAEWEYAARGGASAPLSDPGEYAGSNTIDVVAWYTGNSGSKTHPVGQKKPNQLGLYDMSGNVWEWCSDWYSNSYYSSSPSSNPQGPSSGSGRVSRGGSWSNYARYCRAADRYYNSPDYRNSFLGFRVVLVP